MKLRKSTFYYEPKAKKDDSYVLKHIHEISADLNQTGYISMTQILKKRGLKINKKRVYRIMKENDLLCVNKEA